jgi:hypothetical protein
LGAKAFDLGSRFCCWPFVEDMKGAKAEAKLSRRFATRATFVLEKVAKTASA